MTGQLYMTIQMLYSCAKCHETKCLYVDALDVLSEQYILTAKYMGLKL